MKDLMFSNLKISKLNDISNLKKVEKLDLEILNFQVEEILNEILEDENTISKVKEEIIKYEDSDLYTKKYLYNISPTYKFISLKKIWNEIYLFRKVKNDGDSFFRSFMFSYLEKIIIYKKITELTILIYYISINIMNPFHFRNIEIKKNEVLIILGMILSSMKKDDINNSIIILNRAFCSNDNFSNSMIKYMKFKLGNFISDNYTLFNYNELISNKILSKKYFNKDLKNFNFNKYLNERLLMMQTDPDFFIFLISSLTFNCNVKLYINEAFGELQLIHDNKINENEINIHLIYSEKNFQIAYLNDYYNNNINELSYKIYENENIDNDNIIKLFCDNITCEKCLKESKEIILEKILPNFPICQNCLINNINKVLSNRIKYFSKDNYKYQEYYTRDIDLYIENNLEENNKLKLSIPEFKYLFGENNNIISQMIFLMNNSCLICGNLFEKENDFLIMNCNCKLCKNCIGEIILKDTDDKIILLTFEKIKLNIKPTICSCGNPFDLDDAILKLYNEEELKKYKEKANQRLIKFCFKYCMICLKKNDMNFFNVEILKDKNNNDNNNTFDYNCTNENHILCNNCFFNLEEIAESENQKNIDDDDYLSLEIDCCICYRKHLIKLNKNDKKSKKKEKDKNNNKEKDKSEIKDDSEINDSVINNEKEKKKKKKKINESSCCNIF